MTACWRDAGAAQTVGLDCDHGILAALPLADSRHKPRAALLVVSDGGADAGDDVSGHPICSARSSNRSSSTPSASIRPSGVPSLTAVNPATALARIADQAADAPAWCTTAPKWRGHSTDLEEPNGQYSLVPPTRPADGKYPGSPRVRVSGGDYRVRAQKLASRCGSPDVTSRRGHAAQQVRQSRTSYESRIPRSGCSLAASVAQAVRFTQAPPKTPFPIDASEVQRVVADPRRRKAKPADSRRRHGEIQSGGRRLHLRKTTDTPGAPINRAEFSPGHRTCYIISGASTLVTGGSLVTAGLPCGQRGS